MDCPIIVSAVVSKSKSTLSCSEHDVFDSVIPMYLECNSKKFWISGQQNDFVHFLVRNVTKSSL